MSILTSVRCDYCKREASANIYPEGWEQWRMKRELYRLTSASGHASIEQPQHLTLDLCPSCIPQFGKRWKALEVP